MKNWFLHILLLAGLFGVLTTSCSQEEGLEPQVTKEKVQVSFSISMSSPSADSRAITLSGVNEFENEIDSEMLFVQLDLDGETCDVNKLTCFNTGTNNVYNIVGEIDVELRNQPIEEAKIIVHANIPNGQTEFDVNYVLYPHKGVNCIPMWGMETIEDLTLTPGGYNNFGTIDLLRSMAKIEVILGEDVINEGYKIDKAGLGKHNTKGNLRPKDWANYARTTDFYNESCCNSSPYKNVAVDPSTLGLPFEVASDGKSCTIYVPEYDYQKEGDDVMIHLEFQDNEQTTVKLQSLGIFSMGEQDLIRNHWYKYEIISIKSGVDMEVIITINPWNYRDVTYSNTPLT